MNILYGSSNSCVLNYRPTTLITVTTIVAIQPISIIIGIYREETLMTSKMEILPDDGTAVLFTVSETLGMHFWIDEDAVFMSAPSYATGGGCDMDNAIAVEDWENFDELSAHELSHLFGFVFKMCVLKRDYVRIGYYAKVFGGTD